MEYNKTYDKMLKARNGLLLNRFQKLDIFLVVTNKLLATIVNEGNHIFDFFYCKLVLQNSFIKNISQCK